MENLKSRLQNDLATAMKARDDVTTATLRLALAAITNEEVAGERARELSDAEVVRVLAREAKKRREAAEAFAAAGRTEQADRERAEGEVIQRYLPRPLTDAELAEAVRRGIAETGAESPRQMGQVIKAVQAVVGDRVEGRRLAEEVRRQLTG